MIRRQAGDDFRLITQHDHAILSADLGRHYGNRQFEPLADPEPVLMGMALHDGGWPLHDDALTLNDRRLPIDVFESTREIALRVWPASAERAAAADPYAGLLVSLHTLSLSWLASQPGPTKTEKFELVQPRQKFELNRFHHGEIERQERLRDRLGLSNLIPRRLGLAESPTDSREQKLIYDFRVLQVMDKLSLAICCTNVPNEQVHPAPTRRGSDGISLAVRRPSEHMLTVTPWPFDVDRIEVRVPYRNVPGVQYVTESALRTVFDSAKLDHFDCVVKRG